MSWVGWYRLSENKPWRRVCQADTLSECSRKLSAATKQLKIRNVNYIMTGGAYPNIGAPPRPDDVKATRRPTKSTEAR